MSSPAHILEQARLFLSTGQAAQALPLLQRAHQRSPRDPVISNFLAAVLTSLGQHEQAEFFARRSLAVSPRDPALLTNLGNILWARGLSEEALTAFRSAAAIAPQSPLPRQGIGNVMRTLGRHTEAAQEYEAALALTPGDPALAAMYTSSLTSLGRAPQASEFARTWLSTRPSIAVAFARANAMTYNAEATPEEVHEAAAIHGRLLESAISRRYTTYANDPPPDRRLRVGILSNELRRHPVAKYLDVLLAHTDRAAFEMFCYSTHRTEDDMTARFRALASQWRSAADLSDGALADLIHSDGIDILIETSGLTNGHRLGVVAMAPAPVQVSYAGYANTTGMTRLNWRIVDVHTDPPGAEAWSSERLERLDPSYYCFGPRGAEPVCGPPPHASNGYITFGSFNSGSKIGDAVLRTWARILGEVPGSRLLLKNPEMSDPLLREDVVARLESFGAARGAVTAEGPTKPEDAFLREYYRIDIALDPFPYSGMVTTMEALWMGVPVVALEGRMHAGRGGVSILHTLGVPELVGEDTDAYVRIATSLARETERISRYRATLRERVRASPLSDGPAYALRMTGALRRMWHAWCAEDRQAAVSPERPETGGSVQRERAGPSS